MIKWSVLSAGRGFDYCEEIATLIPIGIGGFYRDGH